MSTWVQFSTLFDAVTQKLIKNDLIAFVSIMYQANKINFAFGEKNKQKRVCKTIKLPFICVIRLSLPFAHQVSFASNQSPTS